MPDFIHVLLGLRPAHPTAKKCILDQLRGFLQQLLSRDFRFHQVRFVCRVVRLLGEFPFRFRFRWRIHGGSTIPCTFGRCRRSRSLGSIRLRLPLGLSLLCSCSFVYLDCVFVVSLSLGAVPAQVMPCVASASERFEENLGQPLVFLDGMAQGFDVGFLCERFGRLAHLTTKRMKYAAVMTMPAQNAAMRSCLISSGEGGRLDLRIICHLLGHSEGSEARRSSSGLRPDGGTIPAPSP